MQDDSIKSAEYCRARGAESERMGTQIKDLLNEAIVYELANRWRRLAKESKSDALKPIGGRPRAIGIFPNERRQGTAERRQLL